MIRRGQFDANDPCHNQQKAQNPKDIRGFLEGKLLGWGQTSLGHGQSGCLIHELHCESETVVYKGDCSTWTVEKLTIAK